MIIDKLKNNKGFALLFAVTISAMLLAIALGVSNIALKEINFSTSARNTNDAFFAADTGVECLLTNDKSATSVFTSNSPASFNINCVNSSIPVVKSGSAPNYAWDFTVLNLGSAGGSCAKVRVTKDFTDIYDVVTVVSSRGYNMGDSACNSTSSSRVEREIEVVYGGTGVPSAPEDPPPPPPPPPSSSILTISKAGTGTGTVTSSIPAGTINCGADCAETYTDGTAITLTASANSGSTFAGWSGGGCSGTGNCSLTINSNQTITATFNTTNAVPTVTTPTVSSITSSGATLGANVTSLGTPASISARGTCWGTSPAPTSNCIAQGGTTTGAFTHARTGMSANTLYYYRGYATNTSGTGYSVDGTFTTSSAVTQYTLTVTKSGTGLGIVSSFPNGINCNADCTEDYNDGTDVTLSATNSPGSTFAGWSGACTGTDPACFVDMTTNRNVTAIFNLDAPPPQDNIVYYGSSSTPADNGSAIGTSQSIVPPAGMQAGDLVLLYGQYKTSPFPTINATGGQNWKLEASHTGNPRTLSVYSATFNGTWSANPSMTGASTEALSLQMHVYRGIHGSNSVWTADAENGPTGVGAAATNTLLGVDPTAAPNVTIGVIATPDDNTFTANSLGSWNWPLGSSQYRNTGGSDQSATFFHYIQNSTHAATGNAIVNQATLGTDAYTRHTLSFILTSN